ncbi:hypothetical protein BDV25DRAFT_135341 [Aspergillus avenaceus]|uniref:Uncharacterized protein n=1 Tax=Aspergillus avenaceus TaxID=36643 RepID=A0A5N6U8R4_ASPAV|nr:hypothetical protein BDV25DRAFT_135341 [Aspergillus avenaceus]
MTDPRVPVISEREYLIHIINIDNGSTGNFRARTAKGISKNIFTPTGAKLLEGMSIRPGEAWQCTEYIDRTFYFVKHSLQLNFKPTGSLKAERNCFHIAPKVEPYKEHSHVLLSEGSDIAREFIDKGVNCIVLCTRTAPDSKKEEEDILSACEKRFEKAYQQRRAAKKYRKQKLKEKHEQMHQRLLGEYP